MIDSLLKFLPVLEFAVAIVGLLIVILQLRRLHRSVRSGAVSAVYTHAGEFRRTLIEYPELRPYFFDPAMTIPEGPLDPKVETAAEMYLNYLEHLAVEEETFGGPNARVWRKFIPYAFERSPLLRRMLAERREAGVYSEALLEKAGPAAKA